METRQFNEAVEKAFVIINDKLEQREERITIVCAGGYALSLAGIRKTKDVDAFFVSTPELDAVIRSAGEACGLENEDELWLNNSVQNLNGRPPIAECETVFAFSNLKVLVPNITYIAAMKLKSGRAIDVQDAGKIIEKLGITDPKAFIETLKGKGFSVDASLVLEAFQYAYGMEWLEKYYIEHEEELLNMF